MLGIKELLQKSGKNAALQKCQFVKKRKVHIFSKYKEGRSLFEERGGQGHTVSTTCSQFLGE